MTTTRINLDPELLISLIENRPLIWDKTLDDYKDKHLRETAWREICSAMNGLYDEMDTSAKKRYSWTLVKKWNQLRDSWIRSLHTAKQPGKRKKYCYHDQLLFLKKVINIRTEECNDDMNQDNTDDENQLISIKKEQSDNESSMENESFVDERSMEESPAQEMQESPAHKVSIQFSPGNSKRWKRPRKSLNNDDNDWNKSGSFNSTDQKMISFIYQHLNNQYTLNDDRNMLFFKSILPTISVFNDDQTLQFQAGVINLLRNIRGKNHMDIKSVAC